MKIVQLVPNLNEGGVERGVVELNREFCKLGYKSIVISAGGKLAKQICDDGGEFIKFDVASKNIFTVFSRVLKLKNILKTIDPDIIHARSRVPAWLAYLANKSLKKRFITTVHGFNSVSFYSKVMTYGDDVICVSNSIKNYIQKNYKTPQNKLHVIARGIDLEYFNPLSIDENIKNELIKSLELSNKFVITTVCRITQLKDLESFIEAVYILKKDIPNIIGLIVGGVHEDKKEYFSNLKNLVKKLNLEKQICFTGSKSCIREIYSTSNVVISSSKKPESFGRSVAEAIAINKPVVATGHGGVLDIIQEGKNGYFTSIKNPQELAESIKKANNLVFDGYSYIKENFSLKKMVNETIKIYKVEK